VEAGGWGRRRGSRRPVPRPRALRAVPPWPLGDGRTGGGVPASPSLPESRPSIPGMIPRDHPRPWRSARQHPYSGVTTSDQTEGFVAPRPGATGSASADPGPTTGRASGTQREDLIASATPPAGGRGRGIYLDYPEREKMEQRPPPASEKNQQRPPPASREKPATSPSGFPEINSGL
jgi:hypothetical protein